MNIDECSINTGRAQVGYVTNARALVDISQEELGRNIAHTKDVIREKRQELDSEIVKAWRLI
jgi:hypothetical protein